MQVQRKGLWTIFAVLLVVTACGVHPRRLAEKRVEAQLPRLIGRAKYYRVYLLGRHERMFQGKVQMARIVGEQVEIQQGLVLRELVVELREVEYRRDEPLKAKEGTFYAVLDDEVLQKYLASLLPPIHSPWSLVVSRLDNLRVRTRPGEIHLAIDVQTRLGIKLSGELSGQLRLKEGRQVWFEASEIRVIGITVPDRVREFLAELFINRPLIDLSQVKAPIQLERIAIGEGRLQFEGSVLIDKLAEMLRG